MRAAVLTRRQSEVLAAIADLIEANGYQPTYAEIGERTGMSSAATVFKHVSNLQRKGYITKSFNRHGDMKIRRRTLPVEFCPTCGHRKTA